jgi:hypothetical protein
MSRYPTPVDTSMPPISRKFSRRIRACQHWIASLKLSSSLAQPRWSAMMLVRMVPLDELLGCPRNAETPSRGTIACNGFRGIKLGQNAFLR